MAAHGGNKAILAALFANLGIAATKLVAFVLTRSSSMLAESVHSLADSGNQLLLLFGGRRARRHPDTDHPFGYGRLRYFYGFLVAVVLFTLGGLFALYEAWEKFSHPHGIDSWHWVPLAVLGAAIVMESFSFRTAIHEARPAKGERGWWEFIHTAKAPELPVVLLEDCAALLGLVVALCGVSLTLLTGDGRWDAAGSATIGVLLVGVAVVLATEMKSLLTGEGATPEMTAAVASALVGPGVSGVIHMRTLHLGPDELLVAAKIAVEATASGSSVARTIDQAEERVRAQVPIARYVYLEPDLPRDALA